MFCVLVCDDEKLDLPGLPMDSETAWVWLCDKELTLPLTSEGSMWIQTVGIAQHTHGG